jgi:hypothetical protein
MPVPIAIGPDLTKLVNALQHLARSVGHIKTHAGAGGAAMGPGSMVPIGTIADHFETIASTLDAGNAAGTVSDVQLGTIKNELQAIVNSL